MIGLAGDSWLIIHSGKFYFPLSVLSEDIKVLLIFPPLSTKSNRHILYINWGGKIRRTLTFSKPTVNDTVEEFITFQASSRKEFRSIGHLKKLYDDFCGKPVAQKLTHTEKALAAKLASRTTSIIAQADAIRTMAHKKLREIRDIWDASTQKAYDEAMDMKAFVHASLAELE